MPLTPLVYRIDCSQATPKDDYVPPKDPKNPGGRGDKICPNRQGVTQMSPEPSKKKKVPKTKKTGKILPEKQPGNGADCSPKTYKRTTHEHSIGCPPKRTSPRP